MTKETVQVDLYDEVTDFDARTWPAGQDLLDMLHMKHIETAHEAEYWQVCARWALLKKYNLLKGSDLLQQISLRKPVQIVLNGDTVRHLLFTEPEIHAIQERWKECLENLKNNKVDTINHDLFELLSTCKSNNRRLRWSTMTCPPACQFKLHAHPNLELVYCARGALHEVRLQGEPLTRTFDKVVGDGSEDASAVAGPDLSKINRRWYFATLSQGDWLVNEVGSIHKSFTASKGDGCVLIVLWGGSHANVKAEQEPKAVDVQQCVNGMDAKLSECGCTKWETLEETFLPESERRAA